jgi:ribosomal protein S18 acetylase RimI-like enzyme
VNLTLAELITTLPAGYSARGHNLDDAADFLRIIEAIDVHACGESTASIEEIRDDLKSEMLNDGRGAVAIVDADGRVCAIVNAFNELALNRGLFLDVFIAPTLANSTGPAIATEIVRAAVVYSHEIAQSYPETEPFIRTGLYAADTAFLAGLKANGFEQSRILWRMRIDHQPELAPVVAPDGVRFATFDQTEESWRAIHAVQMDSFTEYHDFRAKPYEEWRAHWSDRETEDPALWRVAYVGDEMVGLCMRSKRFESLGFGYIGSLGVLKEFRSRGIARALLHDAFYFDQENGLNTTLLHGDSTNPTGAMFLYQSVGMRQDREYLAYRLGWSV